MVDLSFLEKFTKGNSEKMKRYISMYLTMAPEAFARMRQNIDDKSWQELAVNAHSLKPQADFMGIAALKEVLVAIENKVKNDQADALENLYKKAVNIYQESRDTLQEFVNSID